MSLLDKIIPNWEYRKNLGLKLGSGCSRDVYVNKADPYSVIKVHRDDSECFQYANITEWIIWTAVEGTEMAPFFAKCIDISDDGKYLVQERIHNIGMLDKTKSYEVPNFISDIHVNNLGIRDGRAVMIDYASFYIKGNLKMRKKKLNEWS